MHIGHGSSPTTCCRYKPNASSANETRQTAANTRRGAASNQFNNINIPQQNRRQTVMAIVAQKAAPSSRCPFCPFPLLCCCSRELVPAIGRSHEEPASKKTPQGYWGGFRGRRKTNDYRGSGVVRRYGFSFLKPFGKSFSASASDTEAEITTSALAPSTDQFAGVPTLCLRVNCSASSARRISLKLRPTLIG